MYLGNKNKNDTRGGAGNWDKKYINTKQNLVYPPSPKKHFGSNREIVNATHPIKLQNFQNSNSKKYDTSPNLKLGKKKERRKTRASSEGSAQTMENKWRFQMLLFDVLSLPPFSIAASITLQISHTSVPLIQNAVSLSLFTEYTSESESEYCHRINGR